MSDPAPRRKRRGLRRLLVGLLALLLLLVGAVGLLGPRIAASVVEGAVADALGAPLAGDVVVEGARLSWTGPQRIESVRLVDTDGTVVADLRVGIGKGLLALATAPLSVGTVELSGDVTIERLPDGATRLERAIARVPGGGQTSPASTRTGNGRSTEIRIPDGLDATLDVHDLRVAYVAGGRTIGLEEIDLDGPIRPGQPIELSLAAKAIGDPARRVTGAVNVRDWVQSDTLAVEQLSATVTLDGEVPGGWVEVLAAAAETPAAAAPATGSAVPPATIAVDLVVEGGRVRGSANGTPLELRTPVPGALVRGALPEGTAVSWDPAARFALRVPRLDVPLVTSTALDGDWRGATLELAVDLPAIEGVVPARGPAGERVAFRSMPATLRIASDGPESEATVDGRLELLLEGADRSTVNVQVRVTDGLRDDGRWRPIAEVPIVGTLTLTDLPSWLLEPYAGEIDVDTALGASVSAIVTAETTAEGTLLGAELESGPTSATAEAILTQERIAARGEGLRITTRAAGSLLAAVAEADGFAFEPGGTTSILVPTFAVPLAGGSSPDLTALVASGSVQAEANRIRTAAAGAATLHVLRADVELAADAPVRVALEASGEAEADPGRPIQVTVAFTAAEAAVRGALAGTMPSTESLALDGQLRVTGVRRELLAALAGPEVGAGARLADPADVLVTARPGEDLAVELSSPRTTVRSTIALADEGVTAGPTSFQIDLDGAIVEAILRDLEIEAPAQLDAPVGLAGSIAPIRLAAEGPVVESRPDRDDVEITAGGEILLSQREAGGATRRVAIRDLAATASARRGEDGALGLGTATATAALRAPEDGASLGALKARVEGAGESIAVELRGAAPDAIERLASPDAAPDQRALYAEAAGGAIDLDLTKRGERIGVAATAPQLQGTADAILDDAGGVRLAGPATVSLQATRALLERLLGGSGPDARVQVASGVDLDLRVEDLALAPAPEDGMLRLQRATGTFEGTGVTLRARRSDDQWEEIAISRITGNASKAAPGDPLTIAAQLQRAADEPLASLEGVLRTDGPGPVVVETLAADGRLPTALLDALAGTGTILTETLGPTTSGTITATNVAADATSGSLDATVAADGGDVVVAATLADGALVIDETRGTSARAELRRITNGASRAIFEPLFPLFDEFSKGEGDRPTALTTSNLRLPLDGDLSKLDGVATIDLGSIRFTASPLFAAVLNATSNDAMGELGHNIDPITVRFEQGVGRYDELRVPWGEFELRTRGQVDLVQQRLDVVVFVPLAALSGDLRRATEQVPGLDRLAGIPFRARGPFGQAKLELDPSLVAEELPGALEGIIEERLRDGLKDILDGGGLPFPRRR